MCLQAECLYCLMNAQPRPCKTGDTVKMTELVIRKLNIALRNQLDGDNGRTCGSRLWQRG